MPCAAPLLRCLHVWISIGSMAIISSQHPHLTQATATELLFEGASTIEVTFDHRLFQHIKPLLLFFRNTGMGQTGLYKSCEQGMPAPR